MKFLICPDSFKDCMRSAKAAKIITQAIKKVIPDAEITTIPLSDGGQGFIEAWETTANTTRITVEANNPLGYIIKANYLLANSNQMAIMEIAQTAGLELLKVSERNPALTTSYGVGQLILHALEHYPIKEIIIGLGGSAVNDGGAGMLQALGAQLLDVTGQILKPGGIHLKNLHSIKLDTLDQRIFNLKIKIASDVINPLLGKNGATKVYARQKGASIEMLEELEKAMRHYHQILKDTTQTDFNALPGSGAAGGLGTALLLLGGTIKSGIEIITEHTGLKQHIQDTDYIISGEGSIDEQTLNGKTISLIAKLCKNYRKPLLILCGRSHGHIEQLFENGITAIFPIGNGCEDLASALANGPINLKQCSENIARLLLVNHKK